jgi:hypothetical protein
MVSGKLSGNVLLLTEMKFRRNGNFIEMGAEYLISNGGTNACERNGYRAYLKISSILA